MSWNATPSKTRATPTSSNTLRKPASSASLRTPAAGTTIPSRTRPAPESSTRPSALGGSTTTRPTPSLHTAKSYSSLSPGTTSSSSSTRSPFKTSLRPSPAASSSTRGGRAPPKSPVKSPVRPPLPQLKPESPTKPALSLKEQIAQRRAEAKKKLQSSHRPGTADLGEEDGLPEDDDWNGGRGRQHGSEEEDVLGRRSVKDSIERARETGTLNLNSRSLSHLPTNLFSICLGVEPELLPDQHTSDDTKPSKKLAYYEIVDLTSLKARDNAIVAMQPELSMFGSLKVLDFAKNQLSALPASFGDLVCLVHLDLSENKFETLPDALVYLPALTWLDLSKNGLKSFMLDRPSATGSDFGTESFFVLSPRSKSSGIFPELKTLNLADNQLAAKSFGGDAFPLKLLVKLDLTGNPLGLATELVELLAGNPLLKELSLARTELEDGTFNVPTEAGKLRFKSLQSLDLLENAWLQNGDIEAYFQAAGKKVYVHGFRDSGDRPGGALDVRVGARDLREAWEIEAEARSKSRQSAVSTAVSTAHSTTITDESSGLGIGEQTGPPVIGGGRKRFSQPKPVEKEAWEEEIDQGLHTEAGRLRQRLAEEAKAAESQPPPSPEPPKATLEKYYDANARSIALPTSRKAAHNRHASLVLSRGSSATQAADPNVPTETLPLVVIASQPWATALRALHLSNRRADVTFALGAGGLRLDKVEEVLLDGCGLSDQVRVKGEDGGEDRKVGVFEALGAAFPAIATLDLSENTLTSVSGIVKLFFPENALAHGRGLKVLRLKGNSISSVEGLVEVAERFGRGESDGWRGEEIDIRDNQIPKLPPVLGLLQLDVLLVEGNAFRVPPRTVWLREGTQGLLKYLRESAG